MRQPTIIQGNAEQVNNIGNAVLMAVSMARTEYKASIQECIATLKLVAEFLEEEHGMTVLVHDEKANRPTPSSVMNN